VLFHNNLAPKSVTPFAPRRSSVRCSLSAVPIHYSLLTTRYPLSSPHSPVQSFPSIMPSLRRTQTIYVTLDPFLSPRGAVLHHFNEFLQGLDEAQFPCIWLTGRTRAQLDEPRRRLGHNDPFIGESGCGVYLPEDYFHLKSGNTIRLGRFTCIPVAKPLPAAAEALEELSADLGIAAVSLRSLSPRELSQNTGLPAGEAEKIRMRDFDELFFFAGATDSDIAKFANEAKTRGFTLQNLGSFWSLSVGADYAKCIRELGALYDRALRYHALRVGVAVTPTLDATQAVNSDLRLKSLAASCDRTLFLAERHASSQIEPSDADEDDEEQVGEQIHEDGDEDKDHEAGENVPDIDDAANKDDLSTSETAPSSKRSSSEHHSHNSFQLHSPEVWENVLAAILSHR
jgi:predicted mannosyl-3-phosphoglycerate phosphatase (HAD superfamily)